MLFHWIEEYRNLTINFSPFLANELDVDEDHGKDQLKDKWEGIKPFKTQNDWDFVPCGLNQTPYY